MKLCRNTLFMFHPVVPFEIGVDQLLALDLTANNKAVTETMVNDIDLFSAYIDQCLIDSGARYAIGGYNEHRTVYSRSRVFDDAEEPRRLHLGTDIWGHAGTPVFAPLNGVVHSFGFHETYGDYGAVIILQHELEGEVLHTLYGHLSFHDLDELYEGKAIYKGEAIAHFGEPHENGHWPPHLHFQLIKDMQGKVGDYPGVCKFSEKEQYLSNCPDPSIILKDTFYE